MSQQSGFSRNFFVSRFTTKIFVLNMKNSVSPTSSPPFFTLTSKAEACIRPRRRNNNCVSTFMRHLMISLHTLSFFNQNGSPRLPPTTTRSLSSPRIPPAKIKINIHNEAGKAEEDGTDPSAETLSVLERNTLKSRGQEAH